MSPSPTPGADRNYTFGSFRLHLAQKQLMQGGVPVRLGSRALELLVCLVERPGEVLSRQVLESRVWPSTVVEETSLRVHIAALRKALRDGVDGARYITNVPGRGYCFVAPVQAHADVLAPAAVIALAANRALNNLPARLNKVVGRQAATGALREHLRLRRLVSVMGPGGIGKTTVALATAEEHLASYEHGAVFVDLAPLAAPDLVPTTVAMAMGLQPTGGALLPQVCDFLRDRQMLLVLDNCEHVLSAAAHLVEAVMREAPDVHILATTREPLFAESEWVYRLLPLDVPGSGDELTQEQAIAYPAIRLFVERAQANSDGFELTPESLPAVRQLCRRLDGIPLAIELAAARVGSLGVLALAQRLDDLFQLLNRGRRTAMPRHQTLEALLDWSYELLTVREQDVLRRLSVFRSSFDLDAAVAVTAGEGIEPAAVLECLSSLALKSLVNVDTSGPTSHFRLLYMTRAYAARKLADSGEMRNLQLRKAKYLLGVTKTSVDLWGLTAAERLASYGTVIDDLRDALDWAFSPDGDLQLGVELTASGWVATVGLGLSDEYAGRVRHALECVRMLSPPQPRLELSLCVCWCFLSGQSVGMGGAQQVEMFERVRTLATECADVEHYAEALYAMSVGNLGQGRYAVVRQLMLELQSLVDGDAKPLSVLVGDRLLVQAYHHLGEHGTALALAAKVLGYPMEKRHAWFVGQVPRSVSMLIVEARTLWMQGRGDQATVVARQAVENAISEHPFALTHALALGAIPIALWRGERDQARDLVQALTAHAGRHSLAFWQSWANGYARAVEQGLDAWSEDTAVGQLWTVNPSELDMLATLSPALLGPAALERVEDGMVGWCGPEVLRAHAVRMLANQGIAAAGEAEAYLLRALEMAQMQGAVGWELRIATSLARLWAPTRAPEAHAHLSRALSRMAEGMETRDPIRARHVLGELEGALRRLPQPVRA